MFGKKKKWINKGWDIATSLLSEKKPDIFPAVSKVPAFVLEDRFIIFYAMDLLCNPKQEFWIITGDLPPAVIDAKDVEDEREAVTLFGQLYTHDGEIVTGKSDGQVMLSDAVIGDKKYDKNFGEYLYSIGSYLSEMGRSFPWDEYGINGKVFEIK